MRSDEKGNRKEPCLVKLVRKDFNGEGNISDRPLKRNKNHGEAKCCCGLFQCLPKASHAHGRWAFLGQLSLVCVIGSLSSVRLGGVSAAPAHR